MTDITNPDDLTEAELEAIEANLAKKSATPDPMEAMTKPPIPEGATVVPLTDAQKASVQAELDMQQGKDKGPSKHKEPKPNKPGKGTVKPQPMAASQPDALLVDILCWPRKHDSASELAFGKWLRALPMMTSSATNVINYKELSLGSFAVEVPGEGWEEVMFSCHVDTVDDIASCNNASAKKRLVFDPGLSVISLDASHKIGSCLGADDGAGIWLMLKMIEAKVPGTYVFHRGEECGGLTAKGNAKDFADYFKKRKMAIAFDRAGNTDVISTQGGVMCASTKFCDTLCEVLNAGATGFAYKTCTGGVYTDTKDYRGLISECVNISVGYQSQHGMNEFQDWDHLETLCKRLCMIKWNKLPVVREPYMAPAYSPSPQSWNSWNGSRGHSNSKELQDDFFGRDRRLPDKPTSTGGRTSSTTTKVVLDDLRYIDIFEAAENDMEELKELAFALLRDRVRMKAEIAFLEETIHDLK